MTTSRRYTLITPRVDHTGPCNVAVDIGRAAAAAGWQVRLLYLSGTPARDDLSSFAEIRPWHPRDLWNLDGVVHTHCLRPDLVGWLHSWNRQCTVMTTLHNYFLFDLGFDHRQWKVRFAWALWSRALRRFDYRVCISAAMRRYYRRLLPNLNFDLAYNFRTPPPTLAPALESRITDWLQTQRAADRIVLAYVGSLSERKNVLALLHAIASMPEIALVLCGRGPQAELLRAQADQGDLAPRILFTGHVADPSEIVAIADLLVLPSHAEGLPLVVLEAARAGRPALMSNIGVHRELAALGLGITFDRHRFSDFRAKAHALAGGRALPPNRDLIALWQQRFSMGPGFKQYAQLVGTPSAEVQTPVD